MVNTQPRLAYLVEHRPIRTFVLDDFRGRAKEAEITGLMPDYEGFCEKRQTCQASLKAVDPELRSLYLEPLLTREQEQHLFRQFNYFKFNFIKKLDPNAVFNDNGIVDYTDSVLASVSVSVVPALERYHRLATQVKQQIVSSNTRLVMNIAKRQKEFWNGGGIDVLSEIVAEGNIGLIRAVDYFDFRKGFKFSTYATWAVIDTIIKARETRQKQEVTQTGYDEYLFEQVIDDREPLRVEQDDRSALVSQVLKKINLRQQKVLKEYFERGRTLQAIAEELRISKERVRQLRDKGLLAIKEKLEEANYAP